MVGKEISSKLTQGSIKFFCKVSRIIIVSGAIMSIESAKYVLVSVSIWTALYVCKSKSEQLCR